MHPAEIMGWLAAGLTLLAFSQRSMIPLRLAAIGANLLFISYSLTSGLMPILALHLTLLPCNLLRLGQLLSDRQRQRRSRSGALGVGPALWDLRCGAGWTPDEMSAAIGATHQHLHTLLRQVESGPALETARALALAVARIERALPPCIDSQRAAPDPGHPPTRAWPQVATIQISPLVVHADTRGSRRADN